MRRRLITNTGDDPAAVVAAASNKLPTDKSKAILVFCGVGGRAARFKGALVAAAYSNVKNAGGYADVKAKIASQST